MKKIIKYCFDKWWRPVLFFGLTILIMVVCEFSNEPILQDSSFLFFLIGFLGLVTSTILQLVKRRWLFAITSTVIIAISFVGFIYYSIALFWKDQSMPDKYADDLKIPTNIKIFDPKDGYITSTNDNINEDEKEEFVIYNSFQPGLYQYELWLNQIDSGTVFLKAYEITQNDRLSESRLTNASSIRVGNSTDQLKKFKLEENFTIYEGDWAKPYAARFEVWYQPDLGKERKLTEKNYKIEGWQR